MTYLLTASLFSLTAATGFLLGRAQRPPRDCEPQREPKLFLNYIPYSWMLPQYENLPLGDLLDIYEREQRRSWLAVQWRVLWLSTYS
jgi:hypothetical protein